MDKAPDAFRTISEVAEDLDLPQHVLRFWETRFPQIKPLKRGGGRRYYRPDDVLLLRGIRHLLYGEGYTIKGVQRIIREQGAKHVMVLWQEDYSESSEAPRSPELLYTPESQGHQAYAPPQRGEGHKVEIATHNNLEYDSDTDVLEDEDFEHEEEFMPDQLLPEVSLLQKPEQTASLTTTAKPVSNNNPLNTDDHRRLQATLYELMECKRILEGAR